MNKTTFSGAVSTEDGIDSANYQALLDAEGLEIFDDDFSKQEFGLLSNF